MSSQVPKAIESDEFGNGSEMDSFNDNVFKAGVSYTFISGPYKKHIICRISYKVSIGFNCTDSFWPLTCK